AQHLVVAYSGAGSEAQNGISGPYALGTKSAASASAPFQASRAGLASAPDMAAEFHAMLRSRESELARDPALRSAPRHSPPQAIPPVVGTKRTFQVCANVSCSSFVNVLSTAKFVGPRGAIFVDDTVPAGGLSQQDVDSLGSLFDGASPNIYGIDTTAFGRESDLDNNGVVIVLLSDAVNKLSGTCPGGSIILGYFFGLDLVNDPHSNQGEVFYGLVPNPNGASCAVDRNFVFGNLPPVLIHEFQHMISFNQHVMLRAGNTEQTWLNEGLSHFAEELGGRVLPGTRCPGFSSCLQQFANGNVGNAGEYLTSPDDNFLVYPGSSFGTLPERGGSWLFVRWLMDHEAADTLLGTDLTRALLATTQVGAGNVVAATGKAFAGLVGEWQMANFVESDPSIPDLSARLRYRSWDFATIFGTYPLVPDNVTNGTYANTGTLRGGSGKHVIITQGANAAPVDLQLKGSSTFSSLVPRLAVVRIQ
ncbi:MAG: hypothetical protein ABI679_13050, partial [Gemmatimonadota bacterium]